MLGSISKVILPVVILTVAGCWPSTDGNRPDVKKSYFYYPIGLGLTQPEGHYLLVASSNFDLLYNSSTVVPVNLAEIRPHIEECRTNIEGLGCGKESFVVTGEEGQSGEKFYEIQDFVLVDHSVYIGSYATTLAVTPNFAFVPVRSDASLHFISVNEVDPDALDNRRVLRCLDEDTPDGVQECRSERRVRDGRRLRDDDPIDVAAEPFGIQTWTQTDEYVVVGHMTGGEVSLFQRRDDSFDLIDVLEVFDDGTTGIVVDDSGRFLATSRYSSTLVAFEISPYEIELNEQGGQSAEIVYLKEIDITTSSESDNQRGITLSPDKQTAFIVSREPPSVLVLDISLDESGGNRDEFVDVIEVGNGPSIVRVHETEASVAGYLVYVVCFDEDRIFVIDPSFNEVIKIISTRRGPHDLVFDDTVDVAYLLNFLESTVSVLDVREGSDTYHSILTTLGWPRRPRSND